MKNQLSILKGIHPGFVLDRELKKRHIRKKDFSIKIHEHPQTITAITKGRRDMNLPLSLRIESELGLEEGFFMTLQLFYDIEKEKQKQSVKAHPDLSKIRPIVFWDTNMDAINWDKNKKVIIKRIFERGNHRERQEITRFYGKDSIDAALKNTNLHASL